MDAGIDVARSTRGGAHAEEQEAGHAHAQQDGEEELSPTGRVHPSARRAGLWKPFVAGVVCGGSPEGSSSAEAAGAMRMRMVISARYLRSVSRPRGVFAVASVDGHTSF